jgi:hypothetical protein
VVARGEVAEQQARRQVVALPEDRNVTLALRFNAQQLEAYFQSVRSFQHLISPAELYEKVTGLRLDAWLRELLEEAWSSVVLGTVPLMEVYPIAHQSAFESAFWNEVSMHVESVVNMISERMRECIKLYSVLPEIVQRGEKDKYAEQVERCIALTVHAPRIAPILAKFIVEFTHRKAQFSLPLRIMPNSVKGKAGIWTD